MMETSYCIYLHQCATYDAHIDRLSIKGPRSTNMRPASCRPYQSCTAISDHICSRYDIVFGLASDDMTHNLLSVIEQRLFYRVEHQNMMETA
jgi:hypothetical protein